MKKNLFYLFFFFIHFLHAQDFAGNKAFPKFLNSSTYIIQTYVDDDGSQIILANATGNIIINGTNIMLARNTLILLRHKMTDSTNFQYVFLSDLSLSNPYSNTSNICKTKKGFGFCINQIMQTNYFSIPLYPVKPATNYNTAFLEFDTLLNFIGSTKFGSSGSLSITKIVSDSNDNKCCFLNHSYNILINDTIRLFASGTTKYSMISFRGNTINWQKPFLLGTLSTINPIQLASVNGSLYFLLFTFSKNIDYDSRTISKTGLGTYCLLRLNLLGEYLKEIETDSSTYNNLTNSFIATESKVFLNLPYTTYLKVGNLVFSKLETSTGQVIFEMDTGFNILSTIKLSSANGALSSLKAYSKQNELLYFNLSSYVASTINKIKINDSIYFLTTWINYPANTYCNTLFAYSTKNKMLVSSYDITVNESPLTFDVYCPDKNNPEIYCHYYTRSSIKTEGKNYLNSSLVDYSFSLRKPSLAVSHPTQIIVNRQDLNNFRLSWNNNDIYDSMEIQKFNTFSGILEGTFMIHGIVNFYQDYSSSAIFNYQYKIKGFRMGESSLRIASDSSSTADSLLPPNFLIAGIFNNSSISLNWGLNQTPARNIYFRELYRSENRYNGFKKIVDITPRTLNNYIDTNLSANKAYYYFVRDYNDMYDVQTDTVKALIGNNSIIYSNTLIVFPNPSKNIIYYYLSDFSSQWVSIYDSKGSEIVLPISEKNGTYFTDISILIDGVYTISIMQYGTRYSKKILKF